MLAKKTLDQFNILERDNLEEIADLKHLVIRLEDEITMRDNMNNSKGFMRRHYSSVKAK